MLTITLCNLTWHDQDFILKVYMAPLELSGFAKAHAGKQEKQQEVTRHLILECIHCEIPTFELVVWNDPLSRMDTMPGSIARKPRYWIALYQWLVISAKSVGCEINKCAQFFQRVICPFMSRCTQSVWTESKLPMTLLYHVFGYCRNGHVQPVYKVSIYRKVIVALRVLSERFDFEKLLQHFAQRDVSARIDALASFGNVGHTLVSDSQRKSGKIIIAIKALPGERQLNFRLDKLLSQLSHCTTAPMMEMTIKRQQKKRPLYTSVSF